MNASEFGQFISEMRKKNKLTQAELARKLDVTDKAVSRGREVWDSLTSIHLRL